MYRILDSRMEMKSHDENHTVRGAQLVTANVPTLSFVDQATGISLEPPFFPTPKRTFAE